MIKHTPYGIQLIVMTNLYDKYTTLNSITVSNRYIKKYTRWINAKRFGIRLKKQRIFG
jgi:hypothetical protein